MILMPRWGEGEGGLVGRFPRLNSYPRVQPRTGYPYPYMVSYGVPIPLHGILWCTHTPIGYIGYMNYFS